MTVLSLPKDIRAHNQKVHFSTEEAIQSLRRSPDDGLVFIERGIDQDGDAGDIPKAPDEFPVERIDFFVDGLQTARAISMNH